MQWTAEKEDRRKETGTAGHGWSLLPSAFSLLPLVLALVSCGHPAAPPPAPAATSFAVAIDSTAYHRRGNSPVSIPFTVTNRSSETLYLTQCKGSATAVVDRLSWGNFRQLEGDFCSGPAEPPLALAAGASASGSVLLYDGGNYRLRVAASGHPDGTGRIDVASQPFDVW